jgi:hypothetical protein
LKAIAAILTTCIVLAGQPNPVITPFADFEQRVAAYLRIHDAAAAAMGKLSTSKSPAENEAKTKAMYDGIRERRAHAAAGDIFSPAIAQEFRRLIGQSVRTRPRIKNSIRSGEEVLTKLRVNGSYPADVPFETMPPTLLAGFPVLPQAIQYRFVGSSLVLQDVSANLIVDFLPNAIAYP